MKKLYIIVCLSLVAVLLGSCDDLLDSSDDAKYDNLPSMECTLHLTVDGFMVGNSPSSRSAMPSGETESLNENEKKIHNLWVLQFGYGDNGKLLSANYFTINSQEELDNLPVVLKKLEGYSNIVVVANTNDSNWVKSSNIKTYGDFKTKPLSEPRPLYASDLKQDLYGIPMAGSKTVVLTTTTDLKIPLTLMYSKLKIKVKIRKKLQSSLYNVNVTNIPWSCIYVNRSGSDELSDPQAEICLTPYPENTDWISRSFSAEDVVAASSVDHEDSNNFKEYGEYVIYVPENIQGEVDDNLNSNENIQIRNEMAPSHALAVTATIRKDGQTDDSEFKVYPGCNKQNNFNVKRNRVYNVTITLNKFEKKHQPSSNCFVVVPGDLLSFEPYYRTEVGGGYNFSSYLSPDNAETKIDKVKILWQTKDCIGDNTNGDLVYLKEDDELDDTRSKQKIYVKTQKEGNALVAAYNAEGKILWSWHIWVTKNDPGNIGNSVVYTTYDWDANGINSDLRVPRFNLMSCNLGALDNTFPTSNDDASLSRRHGLLYQWGRKDPFPGIAKHVVNAGGVYDYKSDMVGEYYANDNTTQVGMTASANSADLFHSYVGGSSEDQTLDGENPILYSIQHPTVFVCGTGECNHLSPIPNDDEYVRQEVNYLWGGDWNPVHDNKLWGALDPSTASYDVMHYLQVGMLNVRQQENTWYRDPQYIFNNYGDNKTIYDPCPAGWRVSSGDLWVGFTKSGYNPKTMDEVNYDESNSASYGMSMYVSDFRKGATSYFPCQGLRFGDGSVGRANRCGNYHNATPDLKNRVNIVHIHNSISFFHNFENVYYQMYVKSSGCPVRCVRDTY